MLLKILLLILVIPLLLAPILLSDKLKVTENWKSAYYHPRWKGPKKTDKRINRMFQECIALLNGLGVPISESICPEVKLTSSHTYFGRCCTRGSQKKYSDYDFYIEIPGWTIKNTDKSLRNTLIHELIHTVPGGHGHSGAWKKWAKFVSEKTEYTIQRCGGDETAQDEKRLREGGYC